jgi:RNA polymerase sigma-70 factor (ECF subfamily)
MKLTPSYELTLIRKSQRGDLEAFNELILSYQDFLFRVAQSVLRDEDAAADATQEALISAFRSLRSFRGTVLRSWLARMVINASYDQLRRKRRHPALPIDQVDDFDNEMDPPSWLADKSPLPEQQVEDRELQQLLQAGLQELPDIYRTVAMLVDVEGLPYEEAAHILHIPVGTVKSRLARARMALREALSERDYLLTWSTSGAHARMPVADFA